MNRDLLTWLWLWCILDIFGQGGGIQPLFFSGFQRRFGMGSSLGTFGGTRFTLPQYASKFANGNHLGLPGTAWKYKRLRRSEGSRGWRETSQGTTLWASLGFDQQKKDHRPSNLNAYSTKFLKWLLISQIWHTKRVFVGMWLWFNHPCSFTALHQGAVKLLCFEAAV